MIKARFPGECVRCGKAIDVGADIKGNPGEWYHAGCEDVNTGPWPDDDDAADDTGLARPVQPGRHEDITPDTTPEDRWQEWIRHNWDTCECGDCTDYRDKWGLDDVDDLDRFGFHYGEAE